MPSDLDIDVPDDIKSHASHDVLEALQQRLQITKDIVATFVKVARSGGNMAQHSVPSQCQRSMSDVSNTNLWFNAVDLHFPVDGSAQSCNQN